MTPFFFGTGKRRLFGAYSPGHVSGLSRRAVVLCPPWGHEYIRAHRSMRQLADRLSAAGIHVLRFDYYGTGDSAGDLTEASLGGWENDILTAVQELQDTADVPQVGLIGLRLGGSLAARVAAGHPTDVRTLVLWDPVVSGIGYVQELMQNSRLLDFPQEKPTPRSEGSGGGHEILGFPLTSGMAAELQSIDLGQLSPRLTVRTLVVVSSEDTACGPILGIDPVPGPGPVTLERQDCQPCWVQDGSLGAGAIPVAQLQRIVQWQA